jgi:protein-tyrosine phosphatase
MVRKDYSDIDQKSDKKRLMKIPGVSNFRDLGGYITRDGRSVKWGQLYRSGDLSRLRLRGLEILSNLDLYAIFDFRSNGEVERQPNRVPERLQVIHLPVMDQANQEISQEIRNRLMNKDYEGFDPTGFLLIPYQQFVIDHTPAFKSFIHTILDARGAPILWHCKSGKDRTGYAAAILLRILGVDPETIFRDYLLSNQYAKQMDKRIFSVFLVGGFRAYRMVKPLMGVQIEWLKAAFETIDEEWGSFESYVSDGLDLSPSDVRQLQDNLLE